LPLHELHNPLSLFLAIDDPSDLLNNFIIFVIEPSELLTGAPKNVGIDPTGDK
jgi:hypothetical protein